MRRFVFAVAAVLAVLVAAALPTRAGAMTVTAPAGLAAAITETQATEEVYWGCRRWHHNHHWHRSCGWRGWGWPFPFFGPWHWHHHRHWGWGWGWHHRHHRGWW
jgi:hypothetical protein